MPLTVLDIVGHASFAIAAFSFYLRDMLLLRSLSIVSSGIGVVYNYFIQGGPLWLVIFWLGVFMLINATRIVNLVLERRRVSFSDEERELFETVFRNFAPVEFMKLMRLGQWRAAEPGETLAEAGAEIGELKLIYNGEVAIEREGAEIARGRDGTLIGEMSFLHGGGATATVRAERATRYIAWPKEEPGKLLKRNPTMDLTMKTVFVMDLSRKLGAAPTPAI